MQDKGSGESYKKRKKKKMGGILGDRIIPSRHAVAMLVFGGVLASQKGIS